MCGTWYIVYMLGSYHLVCRLNKIKPQTPYVYNFIYMIYTYYLMSMHATNARIAVNYVIFLGMQSLVSVQNWYPPVMWIKQYIL